MQEFFAEADLVPTIDTSGPLISYEGGQIRIYVGDIFDLTATVLGAVDAVYDRAAVIALPCPMRARYAAHVQSLTKKARQLMVTVIYDQTLRKGPPFSVDKDLLSEVYAAYYTIACLDTIPVVGGLKGKFPAEERVWLLDEKST